MGLPVLLWLEGAVSGEDDLVPSPEILSATGLPRRHVVKSPPANSGDERLGSNP